ncbi:MAG TPA: hypothetical protein VGA60_10870 [Kiloniellales bacterium]|jgi:4-aminobutyrate--pyruvate transaminase
MMDTVGFSPPLIITEAQIEEMFRRFGIALDETAAWIAEEGLASVARCRQD